MLKASLALLCGAMVAVSTPVAAAQLNTRYDANNANDGIMFDVSVFTAPVTLQALQVNADYGTFDYSVYYRVGGVDGQQSNASAWTLLKSFSAMTTAGLGSPTDLDIDDLALAAGTTYGFYVTDTQGAYSVAYTDSESPVGSVVAADANLAVRTGYGVTYPFGDATAQRNFNGGLTYAVTATGAVPEPASWAMMVAGVGLAGGALRRKRRPAPVAA